MEAEAAGTGLPGELLLSCFLFCYSLFCFISAFYFYPVIPIFFSRYLRLLPHGSRRGSLVSVSCGLAIFVIVTLTDSRTPLCFLCLSL